MQFKKEKKEVMYRFDVDMTEEEYDIFLDYALEKCSIKEQDEMLVNWAIVDILKKQLERAKCQSKSIKKKK